MLKLCKKYLRVPQSIIDNVRLQGLKPGLTQQYILSHQGILVTPFVLAGGTSMTAETDSMIFDLPYFLLGDYSLTFQLAAQLFVLDPGHPMFFKSNVPIIKAVVIMWEGESASHTEECRNILQSIKTSKQDDKWALLSSYFKKADGAEAIFKSPSDLVMSVWQNLDTGSAYRDFTDYAGYNLTKVDIDFLFTMKKCYYAEFIAFCNVLMDFLWVYDLLAADKFMILSRKFFSALAGKTQFWNIVPFIGCSLDKEVASDRIAYLNGIIRKLLYPISFFIKSLKSAGLPPLVLDQGTMNPLQIEIAKELSQFAVVNDRLCVNAARFHGLYEEKLLRSFVLDEDFNRRRSKPQSTTSHNIKNTPPKNNPPLFQKAAKSRFKGISSSSSNSAKTHLRLDSDPLDDTEIVPKTPHSRPTILLPEEDSDSMSTLPSMDSLVMAPRKKRKLLEFSRTLGNEIPLLNLVPAETIDNELKDANVELKEPEVEINKKSDVVDSNSMDNMSEESKHAEIQDTAPEQEASVALIDIVTDQFGEEPKASADLPETMEVIEISDPTISSSIISSSMVDGMKPRKKEDDEISLDFSRDLVDDYIDVERLDSSFSSSNGMEMDPKLISSPSVQLSSIAPPTPSETVKKDAPRVWKRNIKSHEKKDLKTELSKNMSSRPLILLDMNALSKELRVVEDVFSQLPNAVILSTSRAENSLFTTTFEANGGVLELSTLRSDIVLDKWEMFKILKGRSLFRYIELCVVVFDVTDIYFCGSFVNQTLFNRILSRFPPIEYPNLKFSVCKN